MQRPNLLGQSKLLRLSVPLPLAIRLAPASGISQNFALFAFALDIAFGFVAIGFDQIFQELSYRGVNKFSGAPTRQLDVQLHPPDSLNDSQAYRNTTYKMHQTVYHRCPDIIIIRHQSAALT